eukprot:2365607-Lingulodinium_polyedra.AAC.1
MSRADSLLRRRARLAGIQMGLAEEWPPAITSAMATRAQDHRPLTATMASLSMAALSRADG